MSKTRVKYDFARSSRKRMAAHRLTWSERFWLWARGFFSYDSD